MARINGLEKMSFAELAELRNQIDRMMIEKQNSERSALRQKMTDLAKEHGFDIRELLDGRRKGKGGPGCSQISRPQESREHLDRPRPHAALADRRNQKRKSQQG